jgi:hypothetical protein
LPRVGIRGKGNAGRPKRASSSSSKSRSGEKSGKGGKSSGARLWHAKWLGGKPRKAGSRRPWRWGKEPRAEEGPGPSWLPTVAQPPARHQVSLGASGVFLALVWSAATSWRGASRVLALWGTRLKLPEAPPSWYPGRLGLWRGGYDNLPRPKGPAGEWVGIIGHSVQRGGQKWLVIGQVPRFL